MAPPPAWAWEPKANLGPSATPDGDPGAPLVALCPTMREELKILSRS